MIRNYFLYTAILISAPLVHGMQPNNGSPHKMLQSFGTWLTYPEEEQENLFQAIRKAFEKEGSAQEKLQRAGDALESFERNYEAAQLIQASHETK